MNSLVLWNKLTDKESHFRTGWNLDCLGDNRGDNWEFTTSNVHWI